MATSDVARRCGVTSATVRLWERLGKLPAKRTMSGIRLFEATDVERLAAERDRRAAATR